jgi:beta-glucanase (GH16 family)
MQATRGNLTMPPSQAEGNNVNGNILFFDDFSGTELDRSKWNVRITGNIYNDEQQAYVDSPETIYLVSEQEAPGAHDGALVLHPHYRPGFVSPQGDCFDFISGRIDTRDKFDFRYGSAAARVMLPSAAGVWPAFWLLGYGGWPQSGEIDVLEYVGESDWVSAAVHGPGYSGEAGFVNKLFFPGGGDATDWHVYAVDWTPDRMLFKVDDLTIFRVTRSMVDFFGPWVFDNNKYIILNFALGGTYPFKTNGIGDPYYGLPETTVERIRDDQVRMMVDWIQVRGYEG